ncbi:MAG: Tripartite tricarboxylate transporter TctB family [Pseudomonadota bacterium]
MRSEARAEAAVALLTIALSAWFLAEGSTLKPGVFEPIGPGAVPMGVAAVTLILALLVLLARMRQSRSTADGAAVAEEWAQTLGVGAITLGYCALLQFGVLRYGLVTAIYLAIVIVVMAPQRRAALPWALGIGVATGFGLDAIFRHLLVADLP